MFSISRYFRLSFLTQLACIVICVALTDYGEARSIGDESNENAITDETADYLRTHGAMMKSYMNLSVDPCDDFYEYACGNWKNVKPPRQSTHRRNNLMDINYRLTEVTEQLLARTQLAEALNVSSELLVAQRFYNACLAAELFPQAAADPAYLSLIRSFGGFPAVDRDAWNASSFSWFNMSAHLTNYGARGLISQDILPQHPFNPYFKLPELGFDHIVRTAHVANTSSRAYKLNENRMRGYLKAYNLTEDEISAVIDGVFAFWREALSIEDKFKGDTDKCDELSKINEVPQFDQWRSYYEIAWNGIDFYNGTSVEEFCDFYYVELDKVCAKHTEAVANYLAMLLLYRMDDKLKEPKHPKDHKDNCVMILQFTLAHLFNRLYMAEHFTDEKHSEISDIVMEMRKTQRHILENVKWLDTETRAEALTKESVITPVIGNYKNEELSDILIRQINNLTIVEGNYAQSLINLRVLGTYLQHYSGLHAESLPKDTKPLRLLIGMQVNAFYYNLDNTVYAMAGILHPPAYHRSWPDSLKFGTIGYLLGHELTHGFDTGGSNFDSTGEIRDWWSRKSKAVFQERAQCYVDHFNQYMIPEINQTIRGNETMDENIADAGGLRSALAAYRSHMKHLQRSGEDNETYAPKNDQIPGLDLSPEQLFFVGFAQLWCAEYQPEHYWEELTDAHTIDKYRVLGAVSNNDDFAEVYKCPVGSPMHPKAESCQIW
ncbi:neprilysin-1 [Drosophila erecta]|uniref:GG11584 n=1 Tax=Drosophila erecta TaxID=7220 RepID=B3P5V2_DROER|nr:neprilysin-1 [Drosophila erecta]EDV53352.1 uncharacterized protein Dere_GG11584 [Drosophila erecta]